jgi:hypothetical protein
VALQSHLLNGIAHRYSILQIGIISSTKQIPLQMIFLIWTYLFSERLGINFYLCTVFQYLEIKKARATALASIATWLS